MIPGTLRLEISDMIAATSAVDHLEAIHGVNLDFGGIPTQEAKDGLRVSTSCIHYTLCAPDVHHHHHHRHHRHHLGSPTLPLTSEVDTFLLIIIFLVRQRARAGGTLTGLQLLAILNLLPGSERLHRLVTTAVTRIELDPSGRSKSQSMVETLRTICQGGKLLHTTSISFKIM